MKHSVQSNGASVAHKMDNSMKKSFLIGTVAILAYAFIAPANSFAADEIFSPVPGQNVTQPKADDGVVKLRALSFRERSSKYESIGLYIPEGSINYIGIHDTGYYPVALKIYFGEALQANAPKSLGTLYRNVFKVEDHTGTSQLKRIIELSFDPKPKIESLGAYNYKVDLSLNAKLWEDGNLIWEKTFNENGADNQTVENVVDSLTQLVVGVPTFFGDYPPTIIRKLSEKALTTTLENLNEKYISDAASLASANPQIVKPSLESTQANKHVLQVLISNVPVYERPNGTVVLLRLNKGDEVVFTGEEQDDFIKVQTSDSAGWVKKSLLSK
jgi:hypothetical protein